MKNPGRVLAAGFLLLTIGFSSVHGQWKAIDSDIDCSNQNGRFNVWTIHCFSREAGSRAPELLGVRIGKHNGFDRIVFDLKGELEGYTVKYEKPPISWYGDGETINVKGKACRNNVLSAQRFPRADRSLSTWFDGNAQAEETQPASHKANQTPRMV